ncbi:hypothetical protein [Pseudonocardia sp. Ae707_Ps2]|uniref:hypothetical protein n=1 Tax=Pseudonocardia sp. Ae707_Ps2 TaxID=2212992 RepID=UPI00307EF94D
MGRKDHGLIVLIVIFTGLFKVVFRFLTGRPMRGDRARKTDAEWRNAGTRKLNPNGRTPGAWDYLPEWKRAAIRCACLCVASACAWAWVTGWHFFDSSAQTLVTLTASVIVAGDAVVVRSSRSTPVCARRSTSAPCCRPFRAAGRRRCFRCHPRDVNLSLRARELRAASRADDDQEHEEAA